MTEAGWLEQNRNNWNNRVAVHAGSSFYNLAAFRAGGSTLRSFEAEELGDVSGKRLLHLQCHMGQDTLSWARLGAEVTGLDFSEAAIDMARGLAADTGLGDRARFVVSDVYGAADALPGQLFDIVYTGIGALVWLPDLTRWADVVAALLKPGGTLYLVEFHPLTDLLGSNGLAVEQDYFDSEGVTYDFPDTYTDGPTLTHTVTVQWRHPLGDVVTSLARAGLRIELLHERPVTYFQQYPVLEPSDTGYTFPAGHPRIPLTYSLRASKSLG